MLGRNSVSLALAAALLVGAVRLPAVPCIFSNAPPENACAMDCCKNKSCCETSQKRTGPPVQPLAKSSSHQHNIVAIAATAPVAVVDYPADGPFILSSAQCVAHSPPPLALICIRLI